MSGAVLETSPLAFVACLREVELHKEFVPFCHSVEIIHRFSEHCYVTHAVFKVTPLFTFDIVAVNLWEDHLDEAGCMGWYTMSPPDKIMRLKTGCEWLGVKIPPWHGATRVPVNWSRFLLFPVSDSKCIHPRH